MKLKELRESKGYTRRELSEITGLNFRSIQDYEQGHKQITSMKVDSLYRLSLALDCTMEDILEPYYAMLELESSSADIQLDEQMKRLLAYHKISNFKKGKV